MNKLERIVMERLLTWDSKSLNLLREQISKCTVKSREISPVWFFTHFSISDLALPISAKNKIIFGDVDCESPDVPDGLWFLLYIENGYISMLECYTYWDEVRSFDLELYTVKYNSEKRELPKELLD